MTGAGTRRNTGQDRERHSADAALGERVEIRGGGRFKLGGPARFEGKAPDSVRNYHDDFTAFVRFQRLDQFVQFHFFFVFRITKYRGFDAARPPFADAARVKIGAITARIRASPPERPPP